MPPSQKSRGYMVTLHEPRGKEFRAWETIPCLWSVGQLERCPTTLRLHIQGAVYFQNPLTIPGVKRKIGIRRVHLDPMRGTCEQAMTYCTKLETRVTGASSWTHTKGEIPVQGRRTDIIALVEYSKTHTERECWEEYPSLMIRSYKAMARFQAIMRPKQHQRPNVHVFYGPTATGKSWACMFGASNGTNGVMGERDFYVMNTPSSAQQTPWVDGYSGEEDVVLEDFSGSINYRILLRMLDQYPNKMQIKGGMVEFAPVRIWISSNNHPRDWYPSEAYDGGPLKRRLEDDQTGHLMSKTVVWLDPIGLLAAPPQSPMG